MHQHENCTYEIIDEFAVTVVRIGTDMYYIYIYIYIYIYRLIMKEVKKGFLVGLFITSPFLTIQSKSPGFS